MDYQQQSSQSTLQTINMEKREFKAVILNFIKECKAKGLKQEEVLELIQNYWNDIGQKATEIIAAEPKKEEKSIRGNNLVIAPKRQMLSKDKSQKKYQQKQLVEDKWRKIEKTLPPLQISSSKRKFRSQKKLLNKNYNDVNEKLKDNIDLNQGVNGEKKQIKKMSMSKLENL